MSSPKLIAIHIVDGITGDPMTDRAPAFVVYKVNDGTGWSNVAGPTFSAAGGGWYAALASIDAGTFVIGTIDCGIGTSQRFVPWQVRAEDYNSDNSDVASSTLATAASLAALRTEVDAIKAQTDLLSASPSSDQIGAARLRIAGSQVATIVNPLEANLSAGALASLRMQPLIVGDNWEPRFLVLSSGVTVNLTGYVIAAALMHEGTQVMTRLLGVEIVGSAPTRLQIEIDDQSTDNGSGGKTGRGWFTLRIGSEDADEQALSAAVVGDRSTLQLQIRLCPAGASPRTWLRGVVEALRDYF